MLCVVFWLVVERQRDGAAGPGQDTPVAKDTHKGAV